MLQIPVVVLKSIESLQLQARPQILLQFMQLADEDHTTMYELAALVGQDPALSARILTVANSPALYRGAPSKNLTQCLVNIGTRLVRTLASCLVVQSFFSPAVNNRKYDLSGFWSHSLLVAEVARECASTMGYPDPEEAYLSGLLHDVGQLLFLGGMEESYGRVLESCRSEEDLLNAEDILLGTNHTAIGAWLADKWKLSSFMADSILFHHKTAREISSADTLSQIVWSSHVLCDQRESIDPSLETAPPDFTAVTTFVGLDVPSAVAIHEECSKRTALLEEALGITTVTTTKPFPHLTTHVPSTQQSKKNDYDPNDSLLKDSVREMALMQPLQHGLASMSCEAEILSGIRESAFILFGPGQLAFFLVQPETNALSGARVTGQPEILQRLEIPLVASLTLAADAALTNQPRSTFDAEMVAPLSLVDTQIARALGSEGVLYLPLTTHAKNIGVIAFGMSSAHHLRLRVHLPWMMSFSRVATNTIELWRDIQERGQSAEAALTKRFDQQVRKVFHEAGNPLGIINNYLSIIRNKLPDTNNLHQELDILKEEIDRVTGIMRQMTRLPDIPVSTASLDINNLIDSMLVLYGKSLFSSRGITVTKTLDSHLTPVQFNRDDLKQILVNLWNNASDAMQSGGCFTISTHGYVNQGGQPYIEIRMEDTGHGVPPDVMQRLFKPLEPNRRIGHSGIGLSIVAGLVEQMGGHISCRSTVGKGTCFSVLLPQSTVKEQ
ncbi:MAG: HDOD domain-containing protein [Desulfuromonadaceae bacterium]|nr:HDOD domain-containing protein [Desulfuromonadaceae bacterium]